VRAPEVVKRVEIGDSLTGQVVLPESNFEACLIAHIRITNGASQEDWVQLSAWSMQPGFSLFNRQGIHINRGIASPAPGSLA
jgi:hypothetical protein